MATKFLKAINGHISHKSQFVKEGDFLAIEEADIDYALKRLVASGEVVILDTEEEAVNYKYIPLAEKMERTLPSLNPPLDKNGKELPTEAPLVDVKTSLPTKEAKEEEKKLNEKSEVKAPATKDEKK